MADVLFSRRIESILEHLDFSRLKKKVAVKVHFGEAGCTTYINPKLVKKVCEKLTRMGKKPVLVECNVLYQGSRTNSTEHIRTAKKHGFAFAPINILDGEDGSEFIKVRLGKSLAKTAKLGAGLKKYHSMIVLSHFKGHASAGYGGAFKNMGMGLGSRAGKLHMHSDVRPAVNQKKCIGCGICQKHCRFNAITIENKKASIDSKKCTGCAMCIAVCPQKAVEIPWNISKTKLQKKIVDYAEGVVKTIGKNRIIYINVLENITKSCDCVGHSQKPIMKDIGILASTDPVALDKASLDIADRESKGKFTRINKIDKYAMLRYAERRGLGTRKYRIKEC